MDPRFDSNQSYHLLEVDLESDEVELQLLWFYERTALLSMIANQIDAIAAVNGTYLGEDAQFFKQEGVVRQEIHAAEDAPNRWSHEGVFVHDGSTWAGVRSGSMANYREMKWSDMVSAGPLLIEDGDRVGLDPPERASHERARHPRTAVAVSEDGRRVWLVTVDGRAEEAAGLTTPELTRFLAEEARAKGALNLDGGGTTTFWISGEPASGVVNFPSDNGVFDHAGERWTGQGIAVVKSDRERPDWVVPDTQCHVRFHPHERGSEERYIYLGDQLEGQLDMGPGQAFTISVWVKPESVGELRQAILSKRVAQSTTPGLSRGYELLLNESGHVEAILDNGEEKIELKGSIQLSRERWHHLVLRVQGEQAWVFLDGEPEVSANASFLSNGFDNHHFLVAGAGREWTDEAYEGRTVPHSPWSRPKFSFVREAYAGGLDEVSVWHRALDAEEIDQLSRSRIMDRTLPVDLSELVSFWGFDETDGVVARDRRSRIHGTLRGDVQRVCAS